MTEEVAKQPPKGKKLSAKRATLPKSTKAASETTDDHLYLPAQSTSTSSSGTGTKYRRMRDLNNEASKRCRQNRKRKQVHSRDK